MTSKNKKPEGPACACGRIDIYEETKKLKKESEEKDSDSDNSKDAEEDYK